MSAYVPPVPTLAPDTGGLTKAVASALPIGAEAVPDGPGTFTVTITAETESGGSAELITKKEVGINSITINNQLAKEAVRLYSDQYGEPEILSEAVGSVLAAINESLRLASPPVTDDPFGLEEHAATDGDVGVHHDDASDVTLADAADDLDGAAQSADHAVNGMSEGPAIALTQPNASPAQPNPSVIDVPITPDGSKILVGCKTVGFAQGREYEAHLERPDGSRRYLNRQKDVSRSPKSRNNLTEKLAKATVKRYEKTEGKPENRAKAIREVQAGLLQAGAMAEEFREKRPVAAPPSAESVSEVQGAGIGIVEPPDASSGENVQLATAVADESDFATTDLLIGTDTDPARVPVLGGTVVMRCGSRDGRDQRVVTAHIVADGSPTEDIGEELVRDQGNTTRVQFRKRIGAAATQALNALAYLPCGEGTLPHDIGRQLDRALRAAADEADADQAAVTGLEEVADEGRLNGDGIAALAMSRCELFHTPEEKEPFAAVDVPVNNDWLGDGETVTKFLPVRGGEFKMFLLRISVRPHRPRCTPGGP